MEKCVRCGKNSDEIRLYDGLDLIGDTKICERCALLNNTPIIKRPSTSQLKDSEKPFGVRERLMRMSHLRIDEKKEKSVYEEMKELEELPELDKPDDLVFKLVDNFNWIIQTERRRKGLNTKQLADALKESEAAIKLLEKGIVPSKSLDLIRAIEQFLKVRIVKRDLLEQIEEQKKREEQVNALIMAKRPEIMPIEKNTISEVKENSLRFRQRDAEAFRIRDLQRLDETIEKDFDAGKKTKEEVGSEQLSDFGKEDTDSIKKRVFSSNPRLKNNTPSIYDLMKIKKEKEKSIVGGDIQIVDENKGRIENKKNTEKKETLENKNEQKEVKWEDLE